MLLINIIFQHSKSNLKCQNPVSNKLILVRFAYLALSYSYIIMKLLKATSYKNFEFQTIRRKIRNLFYIFHSLSLIFNISLESLMLFRLI